MGVHFDRDGNVITIGGASGGGTTSRTIKYDGRSGEILWGPQIFYGNLGAADVNFSGDALLSFAQPDGIATLRYFGSTGGAVGGPFTLPVPNGAYPTVNLASRLVNLARPNTVLLSDELGERLKNDPRFELRHLHPLNLHGIGRVRPWALRRAHVE